MSNVKSQTSKDKCQIYCGFVISQYTLFDLVSIATINGIVSISFRGIMSCHINVICQISNVKSQKSNVILQMSNIKCKKSVVISQTVLDYNQIV